MLKPGAAFLPPVAFPTSINTFDGLNYTLSEANDQAWKGLRDRTQHPEVDYWGNTLQGTIGTNSMDERVYCVTACEVIPDAQCA